VQPSLSIDSSDCALGGPCDIVCYNSTHLTGGRFVWDFGDGSTRQQTLEPIAISHTYTTFGTFAINLTAFDVLGNSGSVSRTVTLPQAPAQYLHIGSVRTTGLANGNWDATEIGANQAPDICACEA
jgi:PKD domain